MQRLIRWLTSLALVLAAAACGGGGGGLPPAATFPPVLAGDSAAPALPALARVVPVAAAPDDIAAGGVLLTRLSVTLRPDATIGQVNTAARLVGATSITFSQPGSDTLTLAVPRQPDAAALEALALRLEGQPGILFASGGRQAMPLDLPATGTTVANSGDFEHLLATRFPAAWNVRRVAENGCSGRKVTVIVPDAYFGTPSAFSEQLEASFSFDRTLAEPTATQSANRHGFQVVGVLAAKFDALTSTGANPLPTCLQLRLVNAHGLTMWEIVERTIAAVLRDTGPVIVSSSQGYNLPLCGGSQCRGADVDGARDFLRRDLRNHFDQGISWAAFARQSDIAARMLVVQAAGNSAAKVLGRIYPGLRSAALGSPFAIATTLDRLESMATDTALWSPVVLADEPVDPAAQSIALDGSTVAALKERRDRLLAHPVTSANLLLVGAATNVPRLADLRPAPFSNDGASVFAVGSAVTAIDVAPVDGTSFAAPQVAGLAAYLWLLEPALPQQPAATTAALLRSSAQNNLFLSRAIDAWGAVLALDAGSAPTPATARMRLAALDVDADDDFDLADLQAFRNAYLDSTGAPREPATPDHGRFDLNGDGFTGGARTTPMDVDPSGSTRFGAPLLSTLQVTLGSSTLTIEETAVTDAQALCFYAKSALYTGTDLAARDALLLELCPSVGDVARIEIQPATAQVDVGATVTLTAKAFDAQDSEVSVPSTDWQWNISPTSIATIAPSGASAQVLGVSPGSATASVILTSAVRSANRSVTVGSTSFAGKYVGIVKQVSIQDGVETTTDLQSEVDVLQNATSLEVRWFLGQGSSRALTETYSALLSGSSFSGTSVRVFSPDTITGSFPDGNRRFLATARNQVGTRRFEFDLPRLGP